MPTLTTTEREMLDFESQRFEHAGAKEAAIRERWRISAFRYYQILNALIDTEPALAYAPVVVNHLRRQREALRLRRQRESRQRSRSVRRQS